MILSLPETNPLLSLLTSLYSPCSIDVKFLSTALFDLAERINAQQRKSILRLPSCGPCEPQKGPNY